MDFVIMAYSDGDKIVKEDREIKRGARLNNRECGIMWIGLITNHFIFTAIPTGILMFA